jgi:putative nucleotidyltransferase-like protein
LSVTKFGRDLTPEEQLAFEFARRWRDRDYRPSLENLDWPRFAALLARNRMGVLAEPILDRVKPSIPPNAEGLLREQSAQYRRASTKLAQSLTTYLRAAEDRRIDTIVLKGLWLCEKIYQNPAMRPGNDIDILVPRDRVEACLALLADQGIAAHWPNLLADEYFTRHHLHQQRSTPDLTIWFEIHWALDHPYTTLTIDYAAIVERSGASTLLGAPVREMALPDLLLSLCIHLVKHAIYLPSLFERGDLPRIILADGMLMYYLDVAEVLKQHTDVHWDLTVLQAHAWGAVNSLGSVLRVCQRYFDAPVPAHVLAALPVSAPGPVTRSLMARAADEKLAVHEGRKASRFWQVVVAPNGAFILRPVRLLETASYFFASADFLRRRYGRDSLSTRLKHLLMALWQTLRFAWDTFYFGLERYIRLKRLGKSASLSNKLETHL